MQTDTLVQLLWIFPIYSVLGWFMEVVYVSIKTSKFVNRGFLNGFICPIYGVGVCMMILILSPIKDNLLLLFLGAMLFGSLVELVSGFLLFRIFRIRWWDYSDVPFNLNGYICLQLCLIWGALGVILMHFLQPPIAYLIQLLPGAALVVLLVAFYIYFIVDITITVLAIKKWSRDLEEITRLAARIRKSSDFIAEEVGTSAIQAAQRIEESEIAEKSRKIKERVQTAAEDTRERVKARVEDFERFNLLLENRGKVRERLMRAYPGMKTIRNAGAFKEMNQRIKNRTIAALKTKK